jgi:hypothetical protein
VLPQGTSNAPVFFSWVADRTFAGIPRSELINFIDDSTVHSKDFIPHLASMQRMYDALRTQSLILKVSKSHFGYAAVKILGHHYSQHGRHPDPNLVKAVVDLAEPHDLPSVRTLLGLAVFNREYIPNYMELTKPLQDLTKAGVDIPGTWQDEVDHSGPSNQR